MNAIICIDNRGGMMFNKRRQSMDKVLQQEILRLSENHKLYMNEYSYKSFSDVNAENIIVDNQIPKNTGINDYCFIENIGLMDFYEKIYRIIVFNWNKTYPADFFLDIDLKKWKLLNTKEFSGFSHERITMEIYTK